MKSLEEFRSETVKRLEYGYAHGEIGLEEYEKRIEIVINTMSIQDMENAVSDLKQFVQEDQDYEDSRDSEESITAFLSSISRKGQWKPAKHNRISVFMGNILLDFSEADLQEGIAEFEFFSVMGSIDIKVPDGINLELNGLPIMASIENKTDNNSRAGNPVVRFRGTAFMSSITAKPPRRKKHREYQ